MNFYLIEAWSGSQTNVWGAEQCSNIEIISGKTVDECKQACLKKTGCTAISTNSMKECKLKGCPQPVSPPESTEIGWSGHYLLNGNYKLFY